MYVNDHLIIFIVFFLKLIKCEDYYKLLGIKRNASEREIEKAFRLKAKALHPDVSPGKEDEFARVANAYETLKDQERRKIYDQYGEDGLRAAQNDQQHQQQRHFYRNGSTYFTFDDFGFEDFFSDGFRQQNFNFKTKEKRKTFEGTVVKDIDNREYKSSLKHIRVLNLYYHYMENCSRCNSVHDLFLETVTKYRDAINIYAINCNKNTCDATVRVVPHLIAYKYNSNKPIVFDGSDFGTQLDAWLNRITPSELVEITTQNQLNSELNRNIDSKQLFIVAIVRKSVCLTQLKSLSIYVKSRIKIGYIKASNTKLVNLFKLKAVQNATLLHITDLLNLKGKMVELDVKNFSNVLLWLNLLKYESSKNPIGLYRELTIERMESGECTRTDNQFCFILVKYGHKSEGLLDDSLNDLSGQYHQDPVKIRFINAMSNIRLCISCPYLQKHFTSSFNLPSTCYIYQTCTKFIAYRGKRFKYKIMQQAITIDNIKKFINDVITNSVRLDQEPLNDPASRYDSTRNEF